MPIRLLVFALASLLAGCSSSRPDSDRPADRAVLTGSVTYRPRIALPPDAVVTVQLLDVSRADAASTALATQTIRTDGKQVPVAFRLAYDPFNVHPRMRYVVRASIRDGQGAMLWTSDAAYPVLTQGAATDDIGIELVQVAPRGSTVMQTPREKLVGTSWRLSELDQGSGMARVDADADFTLTFTSDGSYSGQADCNRYAGTFRTDGDDRMTLSQGLSTLAACPSGTASNAFFRSFNGVTQFIVDGERMILSGASGTLLFRSDDRIETSSADLPMLPQPTRQTYVYACPGNGPSFTTRTGPGELAVWLPESMGLGYHVLGQVGAASGARYQDGDLVVWTQGETAMLEANGRSYANCRIDYDASRSAVARLGGVNFQAFGQEPGWELTIREGDHITFAYDYATRTATTPAPAPQRDAQGRMVYQSRTDSDALTVTVARTPCADSMSGERFESTVTVVHNGGTYRGCGRTLR